MPHKIEPAPSGRASCRGCKETITKDTLRFGEEFTNPYSDEGATSYRYWHLPCAAAGLANELASALATYDGPVDDRAALEKTIAEHLRPEMPFAERAGSGRAKCRVCDVTIKKGELRVAFERLFEGPMGPQTGAAYVHPRCVPSYAERERERGRPGPDAPALAQQIIAHTVAASKMSDADMTELRGALDTIGTPNAS